MKNILFINAEREGYEPSQIKHTMTAGELIGYLSRFDEETPVYLKHDNGYTYGAVKYDRFEDGEIEDEED